MESEGKKDGRLWKVALGVLAIALLLGGCLLCGFIVLIPNSYWAPRYEVPDVRGLTPKEAKSLLEANGFMTYEGKPHEYDDTATAGQVCDQVPAPGERVRHGTRVMFIVSKGRPISMPKLARLTPQEAKERLKALGLRSEEAFRVDDAQVGKVVDQYPHPGEEVAIETTVVLIVGRAGEGGKDEPQPIDPKDLPLLEEVMSYFAEDESGSANAKITHVKTARADGIDGPATGAWWGTGIVEGSGSDSAVDPVIVARQSGDGGWVPVAMGQWIEEELPEELRDELWPYGSKD